MMFPYLTLNDETEITHSEMKPDGRVKVYIETPDFLPDFLLPDAPGRYNPNRNRIISSQGILIRAEEE